MPMKRDPTATTATSGKGTILRHMTIKPFATAHVQTSRSHGSLASRLPDSYPCYPVGSWTKNRSISLRLAFDALMRDEYEPLTSTIPVDLAARRHTPWRPCVDDFISRYSDEGALCVQLCLRTLQSPPRKPARCGAHQGRLRGRAAHRDEWCGDVRDPPPCLRQQCDRRSSGLLIEVRRDILEESDGPTLRFALQGMHRKRLRLPRQRAARPDVSLLEERFDRFRAEAY